MDEIEQARGNRVAATSLPAPSAVQRFDRGRAVRLPGLIACALLVVAVEARARCMSLSMERRGAEYELAHARQVFVGRLLRVWLQPPVEPEPEPMCQDEACLEVTVVVSGSGPSPWLGEFQVERRYKGEPPRRQIVRIRDDLRPRQRYLVYADRRDGEFVADGGCEGRAFPVGTRTREHLAYLDSLPPAGRGGFADVSYFGADGTPLPERTLAFIGSDETIEWVPSVGGKVRSEAWPPGRYRLLSPPPKGYRHVCGPAPCDALVVQDRVVNGWRIQLQALAQVRIVILNGDGAPVEVEAEFELLDAERETPVDFVRASVNRPNGSMLIRGRLPPGRVVPALIVSEIAEPQSGIGSRLTQRRRWFSAGASFESAPVHELHPGDNEVEFVLPDELQPVTVELQLQGLDASNGWQWVHRSLLGWVEPDRYPMQRQHTFTCQDLKAGPCQHRFAAIPGQTWALSALRHRIQATGARDWSLRITTSERVVLQWQLDD
jgi:hypothetical protein